MTDIRREWWKSRRLAAVGWVVAGIPILVSTVQAISLLIGVSVSDWPVIGILANFIHSFDTFRLMSLAFGSPEPLVFILFLLIAGFWILLGVSLFRPTTDLINYSTSFHLSLSIISALLFTVLFFGVYWNLWQTSLALGQQAILLMFPAGVFSGLFVAYKSQPQTNGYRLLDKAEKKVTREKQEFDSRISNLESELDNLHPEFAERVDLSNIINTRRERAFNDTLEKINEYRNQSMTEIKRESVAKDLYKDSAEELSGKDEYDDVETNVRNELIHEYQAYTNITIKSDEFGQPFEIINHETYRSFEPEISQTTSLDIVNLNNIDNVSERLLDENIGIVVDTINSTVDHLDGENGVKQDLRDRESEFVNIYSSIIDDLNDIDSRFEDFPHGIGKRLEEVFRYGHVGAYDTIGEIYAEYGDSSDTEGDLDRAIENFHQCRFSDAMHAAKEAETQASHLDQVTGFIEHLIRISKDGVSGVEIPDLDHPSYNYFDHGLIENEVGPRLDGVRLQCNWDNGRIALNYTESSRPASETNTERNNSDINEDTGDNRENNHSNKNGNIPSDRINRGIEHILDTVASSELGERDGYMISVPQSEIPSIYAEEDILTGVADHLEDQDDLVRQVHRDALPEYLEFEINETSGFKRAMKQISNRA